MIEQIGLALMILLQGLQFETQRYLRKPVIVDAVQVTEAWFDVDKTRHHNPLPGVMVDPVQRLVFIQTLEEGTVHVPVGEWIVVEPNGKLTKMHHSLFVVAHEKAK